jgi:hypothetical protein
MPGFAAKRCAGLDILAYRATEPADRVAACRRGFLDSGVVVVAGSVNFAGTRRGRSRRRSGRLHDRRRRDRRLLRARPGRSWRSLGRSSPIAGRRVTAFGSRDPTPIFTTR